MNKKKLIPIVVLVTLFVSIVVVATNFTISKFSTKASKTSLDDGSISPERIRYIDNGDGTATIFSIDLGTAKQDTYSQAAASFADSSQAYGSIYQRSSFTQSTNITKQGFGSPYLSTIPEYKYLDGFKNGLNNRYNSYQYKQKYIQNVNNLNSTIASTNQNIYGDGNVAYQGSEVKIPDTINGLKVTKISSVADLIKSGYSGGYNTYQRYYSSDAKQVSKVAYQGANSYNGKYNTISASYLSKKNSYNEYTYINGNYVSTLDRYDWYPHRSYVLGVFLSLNTYHIDDDDFKDIYSSPNPYDVGNQYLNYMYNMFVNSFAKGNMTTSVTYLNVPQVSADWMIRKFSDDFTSASLSSNLFSYSNDLRAANPYNYSNYVKFVNNSTSTNSSALKMFYLDFNYDSIWSSSRLKFNSSTYFNYLNNELFNYFYGKEDVTETPAYSNYKETYHEINTSSNQITSVILPSTVTDISANAFVGCNNVTKLSGAGNLTTAAQNNLKSLTTLEYVELPNITTISGEAFKGCTNLKELAINQIITELGADLFKNQKQVKVACTSMDLYFKNKKIFDDNNLSDNLTYFVNVNYIDPATGEAPTFFTTSFQAGIPDHTKVYASDVAYLPTNTDIVGMDSTWFNDIQIFTEYLDGKYSGKVEDGTTSNSYVLNGVLNKGIVPDNITFYVTYDLKDTLDLLNNFTFEYFDEDNNNVIDNTFAYTDLQKFYTMNMYLNNGLLLPEGYNVTYKYYSNDMLVDSSYKVQHGNDFNLKYEIVFTNKYSLEDVICDKVVKNNYEKAEIKVYASNQEAVNADSLSSEYYKDYYVKLNNDILDSEKFAEYFGYNIKLGVDSGDNIIMTNLGRAVEDFDIIYANDAKFTPSATKKGSIFSNQIVVVAAVGIGVAVGVILMQIPLLVIMKKRKNPKIDKQE